MIILYFNQSYDIIYFGGLSLLFILSYLNSRLLVSLSAPYLIKALTDKNDNSANGSLPTIFAYIVL